MTTVQKIQRHGFRKWYEHELLQSHAHLVLLLLSAVGLLGSAEVYSAETPLLDQLSILICAAASAVIGIWALRRYLYLLNHAEYVADQAVCKSCETYAKWDLQDDASDNQRLQVRCRRCGHHWSITL